MFVKVCMDCACLVYDNKIFNCMVMFHFIYIASDMGPPLSYLHGDEIDAGMNSVYFMYIRMNIMNNVDIVNE